MTFHDAILVTVYLAFSGSFITTFNPTLKPLPVRANTSVFSSQPNFTNDTFFDPPQPNLTNNTVFSESPAEFFVPQQLNLTNDTVFEEVFAPPRLNLTNDTVLVESPAEFFVPPQLNLVNDTVLVESPTEFFAPPQINLTNDTVFTKLPVITKESPPVIYRGPGVFQQCPVPLSEDVDSDPIVEVFELIMLQLMTRLQSRCQPVLAHALHQLIVGVELVVKHTPTHVWYVLGFVYACFQLYVTHQLLHRFFPVWYEAGRAICWLLVSWAGAAVLWTLQAILSFLLGCLLIPIRYSLGNLSGRVLFYANLVNTWCKNEAPEPEFEVNTELAEEHVLFSRHTDYRYIFDNIMNKAIRIGEEMSFNQKRAVVSSVEFEALRRKILLLATVGSEENWAIFKSRLGVSLSGFLSDVSWNHAVINLIMVTNDHAVFSALEHTLFIQRKTEAARVLGYVLPPQYAAPSPTLRHDIPAPYVHTVSTMVVSGRGNIPHYR